MVQNSLYASQRKPFKDYRQRNWNVWEKDSTNNVVSLDCVLHSFEFTLYFVFEALPIIQRLLYNMNLYFSNWILSIAIIFNFSANFRKLRKNIDNIIQFWASKLIHKKVMFAKSICCVLYNLCLCRVMQFNWYCITIHVLILLSV